MDKDDLEERLDRRWGFVDWFTLQHYDRFNGKYVPPISVVDVEVPISGTF